MTADFQRLGIGTVPHLAITSATSSLLLAHKHDCSRSEHAYPIQILCHKSGTPQILQYDDDIYSSEWLVLCGLLSNQKPEFYEELECSRSSSKIACDPGSGSKIAGSNSPLPETALPICMRYGLKKNPSLLIKPGQKIFPNLLW